MSRTTVLFGPPGTGKTTRLLREVESALQSGISPDQIAFFAFTKKAANEAIRRASDTFKLQEEDLPWFRTLHSAAFRILGLSSGEVMQASHYRELGKHLGRFTFKHSYNEDTERVPQGGALGDLALSIYNLARGKQTSIRNAWLAEDESDLTLNDAEWFARSLDEYKKSYQLLDFNDFLDEAQDSLYLKLMIIDEAQDLTKQQWDFARRIGRHAEKVIIAGDDDQAIFQWAGADLTTFLNFKGDFFVLPTSFRLPSKVWQKSRQIVDKIKIRKPKEWDPRKGSDGEVSYSSNLSDTSLYGSDSWMLLSRLKWQSGYFVELCRTQGVVYQHEGVWSNQAAPIRAVVSYEKIRRGEIITRARCEAMLKFIPGAKDETKKNEVAWNDITWPFEGHPDWMSALSLSTENKAYIRALRNNNESLVNPGRIVISTIHGVKGGEAENVLLMTDISKKVEDGMNRDPDAEQRVWYVAASRAKNHLRIMSPQTSRFVNL